MKFNRNKILANIKRRITEEKLEEIKKEEDIQKHRKEYASKYYQKHREEILAKMKEKRICKGLKKLTDPEKIKTREYNQKYYAEHREEILAKRKEKKNYQEKKLDYKYRAKFYRELEKEEKE